jgi:aminoglycoside phosphotransferase (APT) family kinase protein
MTDESGSDEEKLGGARLLDSGGEAEIYEWGDRRVLRLFKPEVAHAAGTVEIEAIAMRAAADMGILVPTVHDTIIVDGRPGLVIDRVDGPNMLTAALWRPWRASNFGKRLGEMHAVLHSHAAPSGLPQMHASITYRLAGTMSEADWFHDWMRDQLSTLPNGDALLHGDLHPLNVVLGVDGAGVIDWSRATAGPAEADVARTLVLFERASPFGAGRMVDRLVNLSRRAFSQRYLNAYRARRDLDMALVQRWLVVRRIELILQFRPNNLPEVRRLIREAGGPAPG